MTREEMYNRALELDEIIRKLELEGKEDEMLNAIDEQLELANLIQMEEV